MKHNLKIPQTQKTSMLTFQLAVVLLNAFGASADNRKIYRSHLLWTARCIIAQVRQAEGDVASDHLQQKGPLVLTVVAYRDMK